VALAHLVARLRLGGFRLLDTQFVTSHLSQFGAREVPREAYKGMLAAAVDVPARWLGELMPDVLAAEFQALAGRSAALDASGAAAIA